jgi:hypothetical protein
MKFIVKTGADGAPVSVEIIDGANGFSIEGVVAAWTTTQNTGPSAISLTILADEIRFVKA